VLFLWQQKNGGVKISFLKKKEKEFSLEMKKKDEKNLFKK